jgi:hypothetical protein
MIKEHFTNKPFQYFCYPQYGILDPNPDYQLWQKNLTILNQEILNLISDMENIAINFANPNKLKAICR